MPKTPPAATTSDLVVAFLSIVAAVFFAITDQQGLLSVVVYMVLSIAMSVKRDNGVYAILVCAVGLAFSICSLMLFKNGKYVMGILFIIMTLVYSFSTIKNFIKQKIEVYKLAAQCVDNENRIAKIEEQLDADLKQMNQMLPSLIDEFNAKVKELIESSDEIIEGDISIFTTLPTVYWWQISPRELKAFSDQYESPASNNVIWETRWVERSPGKEFADAGYEYSALVEIPESSDEYKQYYDEVKSEFIAAGGTVFDFISRGSGTEMETETFQYKEYVHSDYTRASKDMQWFALGCDIDQKYRDGKITDSQYSSLVTEYSLASGQFYSKLNEQMEKTGTKYRPIKYSTNIWTGQMLLAGDDSSADDGAVIIDYRCQIPHALKNIEALRDVNISRVMGDPINRNPMVMAKFHKECVNCR